MVRNAMPKVSGKTSGSAPRKPSSRRRSDEDVLARVHEAGRVIERRRKRLGMSHGEYLEYITQELRKKGHPV
jgi:hypothetical protein